MKLSAQSKALNAVLAGLTMVGASFGALAQTSTTAPMGTTQTPAAVGVTPQTATDANRQAVPRSDTGTVVRTGPNAVDSARTAASGTVGSGNNSTGTGSGIGSGAGTGTSSGSTSGSSSGTNTGMGSSSGMGTGTSTGPRAGMGTTMRAPKADRN